MTVGELIARLAAFDPNLPVLVPTEHDGELCHTLGQPPSVAHATEMERIRRPGFPDEVIYYLGETEPESVLVVAF